jgi:hypothetical protein
MLVSIFNLTQSFNFTPYLVYKKRFKSEINSFCIWTRQGQIKNFVPAYLTAATTVLSEGPPPRKVLSPNF